MPKIKLTQHALQRIKAPNPNGKQVLYWDAELKGFGVLVSGKTNARSYVVQRALPDGRTRRITVGGVEEFTAAGKSIDDARTVAAKILLDMRAGNDPKAGRRSGATLRKTLNDYLEARKNLREKSRSDYRATVEKYLDQWLDLPLRDITPEMIEARHRAIQNEIAKREDMRRKTAEKRARKNKNDTKYKDRATQREDDTAIRRTGHATANGTMVAFGVLWNFAAERDPAMPPNPIRRLKRAWFPKRQRVRRVRTEELPAFYAALRGLPSRTASDYLTLLLFTGLRKTEAGSLTWDNIDFAEKLIRLPAQVTKTGRKLDLPMTDFVHGLLVARRAIGRDGPYVFSADSKAGYIAEPKFPLGQVAKATGIYISAHDLRRTYIGVAEGVEMSIFALKALINHSVGNDVTAGYTGLGVTQLRGPAQRVCDRLKELCGISSAHSRNVEALSR